MIVLYVVAFIVIGLGAALVVDRVSVGEAFGGRPASLGAGLVGALAGGGGAYLLLWYSYARVHHYNSQYAAGSWPGDSLPTYWLSIIASLMGAMLVLACHRLIKTEAH